MHSIRCTISRMLAVATLILAVVVVAEGVTSFQSTQTTVTEKKGLGKKTDKVSFQRPGALKLERHEENDLVPRKTIVHRRPLYRGAMSAKSPLLLKRKPHPCYFKRCYLGQKCEVDQRTGRASCVCKSHCKAIKKPVCGTDGLYYENHCEMHRAACVIGQDIYDARHKDCFYQRSTCELHDLDSFRTRLLEYHEAKSPFSLSDEHSEDAAPRRRRRSTGRSHHHHKKGRRQPTVDPVVEPTRKIILGRSEMLAEDEVMSVPLETVADSFGAPNVSDQSTSELQTANDDIVQIDIDSPPSTETPATDLIDDQSGGEEIRNDETLKETSIQEQSTVAPETQATNIIVFGDDGLVPYDDIITNDIRGDGVKSIFRFMDIDMDGFVGSDEIYQLSMLEDLDSVFPPPCSLFHLLRYGDLNQDHALDIQELLKLYNVTVLHLPEENRIVNKAAIYGGSVTLQCGIQGDPNPIWRHYGYDLQAQGEPSVEVDGDQMMITQVTPRHAGNYSCHARKRPDIEQVIRLSVHAAPQVQIYPRSQHVVTGSSLSVLCHVRGVPPPHITWLMNGDELEMESGRYVIMSNNTELHINAAQESDSAAYSCVATNPAGTNEEIGAVFVEDLVEQSEYANGEIAAFFIFHEHGIVILDPKSCQVLRRIQADETLPGLLRQNKLCQMSLDDGVRHCNWSSAVVVGSRFVYVAQPRENRVVVVDLRLQRVVEVLATDPLPVELHYVRSTDQLFVHCWVDATRDRSNLQIIYAASVPGMHLAAQIQPLDGGNTLDLSVYSFFVAPECPLNTQSRYGYVLHKDQQAIYMLNLATLLYDDVVINLAPQACTPRKLFYQQIGGRLHVTCHAQEGELPRTLTVELLTGKVVNAMEETDYDTEYTSRDGQHVLRVYPHKQQVRVYNVTTTGDLSEAIVLHTNFAVSDAAFEQHHSNLRQTTVYISSAAQAEVMHLDAGTGDVGVIDGLTRPLQVEKFPWSDRSRMLVASSWYDRHVATAGENGVDVINAETKEISCRLHDVTDAMAVTWVDGR
uniref:follistatin-related protein 5 isoform X1 n=1 Tax=Ciona intestinalis TaxID=7719 RepID=UPI000180CCF6|nr:follistatin-related protein 5 isoform X1 [Ciona intestinalis]|eukprot:XP_002125180.1 follistatin-related protein 5 isoform X1 [Ciona intestinalis]